MLYKKYPELSLSSLYLSNQVTSHRAAAIEDLRLKLPKLELSKFDGDIINWREFWKKFLIAYRKVNHFWTFTNLRN